MVDLFDIVYQPSLALRHTQGLAIDRDISWDGTLEIKNKAGKIVSIGAPEDGSRRFTRSAKPTA